MRPYFMETSPNRDFSENSVNFTLIFHKMRVQFAKFPWKALLVRLRERLPQHRQAALHRPPTALGPANSANG